MMGEKSSGSIHPTTVVHIVDAVIRSRKTVRAFRPDSVSKHTVTEILEIAAAAPSNFNSQPWTVHVLTGDPKRSLSAAL
jgi:nitroreductase